MNTFGRHFGDHAEASGGSIHHRGDFRWWQPLSIGGERENVACATTDVRTKILMSGTLGRR